MSAALPLLLPLTPAAMVVERLVLVLVLFGGRLFPPNTNKVVVGTLAGVVDAPDELTREPPGLELDRGGETG